MENNCIKELQAIQYEDVEFNTVKDVREVPIDTNTDIIKRLNKFINDVKNPYIIKCANTIVEVTFSNTEKTIDSQIKSYLKALNVSDISC